ncbi:hypothetical protein ACFWQL_27995 [Amycolatopsis thermoflava]|uniref:hypothetical protein n=1 Tax=Amycolatopsis thermoflava TaxID=84480 RepID=UPI003651AFA0
MHNRTSTSGFQDPATARTSRAKAPASEPAKAIVSVLAASRTSPSGTAAGSATSSVNVSTFGSGRCSIPARARWGATAGAVATATSCPARCSAFAAVTSTGTRCE